MTKLGPYTLGPDGPERGVYTGDSRELAKGIPDASIDIIITDPPYLRPDLPIYEWLANESYRVLKPGGFLFAYAGAEFFPETFAYMERGPMSYFWTITLLHNGGYPRLWYKKLWSAYKPILVYTKGDDWKENGIPWLITSYTDKKDKSHHRWGQGDGFALMVLDRYTGPGAVVWDPFTGGGPTLSAAIKSGRPFLGFEIDPVQAETARERVRKTPDPLFATANSNGSSSQLGLLEVGGSND